MWCCHQHVETPVSNCPSAPTAHRTRMHQLNSSRNSSRIQHNCREATRAQSQAFLSEGLEIALA